MAQQSASAKSTNDRLAARVSKSPPGGIAAGAVAIVVMVLALAGVIPQVLFLAGAVGLIVVAYMLDKRFKANRPATEDAPAAAAAPAPTSWPVATAGEMATPPPVAPPVTSAPGGDAPAPSTAPPPTAPTGPAPSLLPLSDLRAEHARLTQELTDRVDDDEDVRFDKFMRLRKIEEEIERQQGTLPS